MKTIVCIIIQLILMCLLFAQCSSCQRASTFNDGKTLNKEEQFVYTVNKGETTPEILQRETNNYTKPIESYKGMSKGPYARFEDGTRRLVGSSTQNSPREGDKIRLVRLKEIDYTPRQYSNFLLVWAVVLLCISFIIKPSYWKIHIVELFLIISIGLMSYLTVMM